ncbi:MAG: DUF429 domain-containing protein [Candidatus Methanoperedens sp.]
MEKYILGVDAAWSDKNPSGVALLKWSHNSVPELIKAGRSYDEFCDSEKIVWQNRVNGSIPKFSNIIKCCPRVDLVALDIPLSPSPITHRRKADQDISHEYGKKKASTHSPSPERPGVIAINIFKQLIELDFTWATDYMQTPAFIEVYPHVAIIELFGCEERFQYKVQKKAKYWPGDSPEKRSRKIICNLNELRNKIASVVTGIEQFLPQLEPTNYYSIKCLKGYEDLLDAVLSALVGCNFLEEKAEPFGDQTGVIWVPKS